MAGENNKRRRMSRKEWERRRKLHRIKLHVRRAVVLLAMACVLFVIIWIPVKIVKGVQANKKAAEKAAAEAAAAAAIPDPVSITINSVGDCTLGTDESFNQNTSFTAYYNSQDASYFMANVKSLFEADDLTVANFEGTLTTETARADKTYAFKGDPSYTEILTAGGIDAVNLANNHSRDYGEQSYEDTKTNLKSAGITYFGYDDTVVADVKGVKVGLVGVYELNDGADCVTDMKKNIKKVQEDGAVVIIVNFHWGVEKDTKPNEVQVELAHAAIDQGATLVIGHHPHVLQGVEKYKGRYIAYSLGNFCFGGNDNPSDYDTMIFQQTFTVTGDEVAQDDVYQTIPCSVSSASGYNNYQPAILEGDEKTRVQEKIDERSAALVADDT
ncbi:MAG: CapA family protein [Hespellia sp.]|nr:CapA family protein [Hespellia sp.]